MLSEIVESRESASAVTLEGTFTSVFSIQVSKSKQPLEKRNCLPYMPGKMLTSSEAQIAWGIVLAKELL